MEYKQLGFKRSGSILIHFMNIILCKKNLAKEYHMVRFLANKFNVVKTTFSH